MLSYFESHTAITIVEFDKMLARINDTKVWTLKCHDSKWKVLRVEQYSRSKVDGHGNWTSWIWLIVELPVWKLIDAKNRSNFHGRSKSEAVKDLSHPWWHQFVLSLKKFKKGYDISLLSLGLLSLHLSIWI